MTESSPASTIHMLVPSVVIPLGLIKSVIWPSETRAACHLASSAPDGLCLYTYPYLSTVQIVCPSGLVATPRTSLPSGVGNDVVPRNWLQPVTGSAVAYLYS